jgi:hypothetical protein
MYATHRQNVVPVLAKASRHPNTSNILTLMCRYEILHPTPGKSKHDRHRIPKADCRAPHRA